MKFYRGGLPPTPPEARLRAFLIYVRRLNLLRAAHVKRRVFGNRCPMVHDEATRHGFMMGESLLFEEKAMTQTTAVVKYDPEMMLPEGCVTRADGEAVQVALMLGRGADGTIGTVKALLYPPQKTYPTLPDDRFLELKVEGGFGAYGFVPMFESDGASSQVAICLSADRRSVVSVYVNDGAHWHGVTKGSFVLPWFSVLRINVEGFTRVIKGVPQVLLQRCFTLGGPVANPFTELTPLEGPEGGFGGLVQLHGTQLLCRVRIDRDQDGGYGASFSSSDGAMSEQGLKLA